MRLKKHPLTPEGLKEDWAEIKLGMEAVIKNFSGDEWFLKILMISKEWIDAELKKPEPQSPEIAIGIILDPMVKKRFFRPLIRAAGVPMSGDIYRLREDLAMLRKKCRLIDWNANQSESLPPQ